MKNIPIPNERFLEFQPHFEDHTSGQQSFQLIDFLLSLIVDQFCKHFEQDPQQ